MRSIKGSAKFYVRWAAMGMLLVAPIIGLIGCSSKGAGKGTDEGLSESELSAEREDRFGGAGIPTAEGEGLFHDIDFDYDSSLVSETARRNIEYNAKVMRDRPELKVQLEGHCDERGTASYNLSLGAERARSVKDVLTSLGISPSRLDTISYGEEVPLDPGHNETAWSKNRRVHFSGFRDLPKR